MAAAAAVLIFASYTSHDKHTSHNRHTSHDKHTPDNKHISEETYNFITEKIQNLPPDRSEYFKQKLLETIRNHNKIKSMKYKIPFSEYKHQISIINKQYDDCNCELYEAINLREYGYNDPYIINLYWIHGNRKIMYKRMIDKYNQKN